MLVGVVIFVLALSILGLSLFSLSSFEAQFMGGSSDDMQAFYSALGGMERAKSVLTDKSKLNAVKLDLPLANVIYARARFADDPDDTTGTIQSSDWRNHRRIELRVMAEFPVGGGRRRMIESDFNLDRPGDIYTNIVTSHSGVWVNNQPGYQHPFITGHAWQNSPDSTWRFDAGTEYSGYAVTVGGVPLPQSTSYIDYWKGRPDTKTLHDSNGNQTSFDLDGNQSGREFRHFRGPTAPGDPDGFGSFGYVNTESVTVNVDGRAIWMFENGVRFERPVTITGGTEDVLVIVAKKSGNANPIFASHGLPDPGMWFRGGLSSPTVPVILVSEGTVAMDHTNGPAAMSHFYYLSIFGGGFYAKGPLTIDQRLCHHPGQGAFNPPDQDETILDPLYEKGLLPNVTGPLGGTFYAHAGTWREVTEDDPD